MLNCQFLYPVVAALAPLALICTGALAGNCKAGSTDAFVLIEWSAQPERKGPNIRFKLKSNLLKAVRSISAEIVFEDTQGNSLANMPLNPGIRITAGAERSEEDAILNPKLNGVLKPEDVTAKICTRYVVYDDGVFDEF